MGEPFPSTPPPTSGVPRGHGGAVPLQLPPVAFDVLDEQVLAGKLVVRWEVADQSGGEDHIGQGIRLTACLLSNMFRMNSMVNILFFP